MSARNLELQRLLASLNGSSTELPDQHRRNEVQSAEVQNTQVPGLGAVPYGETKFPSADLRGGSTIIPKPQATPILVPDASTITTWPAALKHVTKYVTTNEKVMSRVKHLINEQHKHEEQWWAQRQAIVTRHAGRAGNQTKVADILKDLGGLAIPMGQVDEAADRNELDAFDKKVYKSMVQMAADFDGQLRKMGVPFYAIKHDLIVKDGEKSEDRAKIRKLEAKELRELQSRMLQHLEDLASDD